MFERVRRETHRAEEVQISKGGYILFADVYESVDSPLRSLEAIINTTHHKLPFSNSKLKKLVLVIYHLIH